LCCLLENQSLKAV
jgi:COP9 signalosome complex subunit 1